jgi:hypothetical protein
MRNRIRPGGPFLQRTLLADAAEPKTRAPLYINGPSKRWTQVEHSVNVAVLVVAAAVLVRSPVEPVYAKRPSPQVEVSPNLAARTAVEPGKALQSIDWVLPAKRWTQPEIAPNVAATAAVVAPPLRAIEWVLPAKPKTAAPDVLPNIAVGLQTQRTFPLIETQTLKRPSPQLDLSPNIAVNLQTQRTFPLLEAPTFKRLVPSIDPSPNLAVQAIVARPFNGPVEPIVWKRSLAVDLYPNIAAQAPVATIHKVMPIEPWINKRYPPQIDVYQHIANYVPAEPAFRPRAPVEPTLSKRREPSALEVLPNIAIRAVTEVLHRLNRRYRGYDKGASKWDRGRR